VEQEAGAEGTISFVLGDSGRAGRGRGGGRSYKQSLSFRGELSGSRAEA